MNIDEFNMIKIEVIDIPDHNLQKTLTLKFLSCIEPLITLVDLRLLVQLSTVDKYMLPLFWDICLYIS